MLEYISKYLNRKVKLPDGKFVRIYDFYFDDRNWSIKELIVKKGFWYKNETNSIFITDVQENYVKGKNVLIVPEWTGVNSKNLLPTGSKPIMHSDYELIKVFGWPNLWSISDPIDNETGLLSSFDFTPNMRSLLEVMGYSVKMRGNYYGYLGDFIFDTDTWIIRYVVIKKNTLLPGWKKELVESASINLELLNPSAIILT